MPWITSSHGLTSKRVKARVALPYFFLVLSAEIADKKERERERFKIKYCTAIIFSIRNILTNLLVSPVYECFINTQSTEQNLHIEDAHTN